MIATRSSSPKVVVEHFSMPERRITDVFEYRDAFSIHRPYENDQTDEGTPVQIAYWYAERRDEAAGTEFGGENTYKPGE